MYHRWLGTYQHRPHLRAHQHNSCGAATASCNDHFYHLYEQSNIRMFPDASICTKIDKVKGFTGCSDVQVVTCIILYNNFYRMCL